MQPVFKILANNDNVTELIKERLIRLSITDEIGFVSDAATIVIDNHDDQVEVPARGAELEVYLGYDVDALVKMGKFMVDEVELSGPPNQISITARSSDTFEKSNLGSIVSPKSRSWHDITFPDMVAAIAKENKLSPLVSPRLEGIIVDHIDQTEESDLAFLNRVAQTVDSYVKPADGKLIVAPIGTAISPKKEEKPMPTTELDVTDINSWRITLTKNGKINPALADRQWEANTDPAQVYAIKEDSPARAASSETASSASSGGIGVSYQQSRAIREAYEARLKKLEFDERTGKLISTETVQREAFNAARKTRDMILNVPDKVIPLLIGKTDIHEMKEILRKELLRTLENLANLFDGNRD